MSNLHIERAAEKSTVLFLCPFSVKSTDGLADRLISTQRVKGTGHANPCARYTDVIRYQQVVICGGVTMDTLIQDTLFFFDRHQAVYPLYERFQEKLLARFPESRIKVQKSQISYYNRHLYACVSFLKVKKKAELLDDFFVLTLGLPAPLESNRVAAKTEPYPGRWTTHFAISSSSDLDEELFDWIEQAYQFAQEK